MTPNLLLELQRALSGLLHRQPLNHYPNPEDQPATTSFAFNQRWAKPGPYVTTLSPTEETQFQQWATTNPHAVLGEMGANPDYDIRGFWKAMTIGNPIAKQADNLHFPDQWKTPYDATFSRESQYALPTAPYWQGDKLRTNTGRLVVDETPKKKGQQR